MSTEPWLLKSKAAIAAILLGLISCQGGLDLKSPAGDADLANTTDTSQDASQQGARDGHLPNTSEVGNDAHSGPDTTWSPDVGDEVGVDPCAGVVCGQQAACLQGQCVCNPGFEGNANTQCTPTGPCASVECAFGSFCLEGLCQCDAGFRDNGAGGCVADSPGDTALRTRDEVCQRWNADWPTISTTMWAREPADQCDWGELHPQVIADAIRRTTLFRWVVGLGPVTSGAHYLSVTQACATTLAARNQGLTHSIPTDSPCYTPEAATGAGSSNIAMGVHHPAQSVDLYIGDVGVPSLGHRRWIFNPPMAATGFGQRNAYSCMAAFDGGAQHNPDYVAYPAPGIFPQQALIGVWSFSSNRYGLNGTPQVEITQVASGTVVPVTNVYNPGGGYGQQTIGWQVRSQDYPLDTELEVRITGLTGNNGDTVVYRLTITAC
ncbi:MAG: hypothetical protein H0U74_11145 [Bradymonadaceae bacterium]|nr:hypothetical protein [Lujinxingiaceae bacterium]